MPIVIIIILSPWIALGCFVLAGMINNYWAYAAMVLLLPGTTWAIFKEIGQSNTKRLDLKQLLTGLIPWVVLTVGALTFLPDWASILIGCCLAPICSAFILFPTPGTGEKLGQRINLREKGPIRQSKPSSDSNYSDETGEWR